MKKKTRKQRIQEIRQHQKLRKEEKDLLFEECSVFLPQYCRMLVEHCSRGFSVDSFAAELNIMPELLDEWTQIYPEFKKARTIACLKQKMFWEKKAVESCSEKFSISIFRYFAGINNDENPAVPGTVVILPEEENSK